MALRASAAIARLRLMLLMILRVAAIDTYAIHDEGCLPLRHCHTLHSYILAVIVVYYTRPLHYAIDDYIDTI